ncbi:hypothetical protein UFOVP635_13 [uncultured Caudovirales phage]|uniref:Uncharacterized protein n=1 Tax=uncultured Caudovirales phage TaxID=2100421 RepID=A0A6J5NDQ9_9CAUD|nr:hypothetical protein UFOVP635_13 [uncultured Caudovirales phage]
MEKDDFSNILNLVAKRWVIDVTDPVDKKGRPRLEGHETNPTGYPIVGEMKPCMGVCEICDDVVANPHWTHIYSRVTKAWTHKCLNCKEYIPDNIYKKARGNK